jgi:hypothetical protein
MLEILKEITPMSNRNFMRMVAYIHTPFIYLRGLTMSSTDKPEKIGSELGWEHNIK